MALMTAYLVTTKNILAFFNSLLSAKAPERFTIKFLKDLDFASSNDRLYIGILKGLGFIDENGLPTQLYYSYLDQSQSRRVLADAIRAAYGDLFILNRSAQNLDLKAVKGKLRSLTQGHKSETVVSWMANTFRELCALADWTGPDEPAKTQEEPTVEPPAPEKQPEQADRRPQIADLSGIGLHYNIQLILPESRDQAVYDALFTSLRRHLF